MKFNVGDRVRAWGNHNRHYPINGLNGTVKEIINEEMIRIIFDEPGIKHVSGNGGCGNDTILYNKQCRRIKPKHNIFRVGDVVSVEGIVKNTSVGINGDIAVEATKSINHYFYVLPANCQLVKRGEGK